MTEWHSFKCIRCLTHDKHSSRSSVFALSYLLVLVLIVPTLCILGGCSPCCLICVY